MDSRFSVPALLRGLQCCGSVSSLLLTVGDFSALTYFNLAPPAPGTRSNLPKHGAENEVLILVPGRHDNGALLTARFNSVALKRSGVLTDRDPAQRPFYITGFSEVSQLGSSDPKLSSVSFGCRIKATILPRGRVMYGFTAGRGGRLLLPCYPLLNVELDI